jgi:hypothetical protein
MPMIFPSMHIPLFKDSSEKEREFSLFALRELLEALVKVNVGWVLTHKNQFEPIYQFCKRTGLRYQPERGTEEWLSIPCIYPRARTGEPVDCEDWAAARAAELRLGLGSHPSGPVRAIADIRGRVMPSTGQVRMHAFVRYPDGSVEDPSRLLGMPGGGAEEWEEKYPPELVASVQRMKRRQRTQQAAALGLRLLAGRGGL